MSASLRRAAATDRDTAAYTLAEAARYLRLPSATLRSWVLGRAYPTAEGGGEFPPLIRPASKHPPLLSFPNLIEAHVLRSLRTEHGVPVKALSAPVGVDRTYRINVKAGVKLTVRISGGTGNADLYTRFRAKPTTTAYLCRPHLAGNNETCTVAKTSAGWYYVMVRARTAYSGVRLNGDF